MSFIRKVLTLFVFLIYFLNIVNISYAEENSTFAFFIPKIDGICDKYCWDDALKISYNVGNLYFKNDFKNLYILIDVVSDDGKDKSPSKPFCEDYFELTLDWDLDGKITNGIDRNYTLICADCPEGCMLIYRYYTGSNCFSSVYYSSGKAIPGFGKTISSEKDHRFYEVAIPLTELRKDPSNIFLYGIKIVSLNPKLYFEAPSSFYSNFKSLNKVKLASYTEELNLVYTIGSKNMYINEKQFVMDAAPFIQNSRTYLPLRYILEPFGAYFEWNSKDLKLVILVKDKIIEMEINNPYAYVNTKRMAIDPTNKDVVPILVAPGRVCIPVRFIASTLSCKLKWAAKEQKITLNYKFK